MGGPCFDQAKLSVNKGRLVIGRGGLRRGEGPHGDGAGPFKGRCGLSEEKKWQKSNIFVPGRHHL